jgi:endonuclease YncB( thermonuclease family)
VLDLGFGIEYTTTVALTLPGSVGGQPVKDWLAERGNASLVRLDVSKPGKLAGEVFDGDAPPYLYRARNVRVIDGDTMEATLLPIDGVAIKAKLRLVGLNVAEKNTGRGAHVAAFVRGWVDGQPELLVETQRNHREKYGRMLGTLRSAFTGVSLNDLLLEHGLAVPYDGGARAGA